jgi:uncharacterized protein YxeA
MKYLILIIALTLTAPTFAQLYTPSYQSNQQKNDNLVQVIAQTEDGKKRLKVKYEINPYSNKIEKHKPAYYHNGNQWTQTYLREDDYGIYILYYGLRYYL